MSDPHPYDSPALQALIESEPARQSKGPAMSEVEKIAAGLTEAQRRDLCEVCRTNGGGVRVRCRVRDDGYGEPVAGPMRKLFDKGLIQGKSGSYETVVHTPLGLAVRRHLQEQANVR